MRNKQKRPFGDSEMFWSDIHKYIDDRKAEIEEQRSKNRAPAKRKCPDCQSTMHVEDFNKILIDKCAACGGVFLDKGELDLLFKTRQQSGFIPSLKNFFS